MAKHNSVVELPSSNSTKVGDLRVIAGRTVDETYMQLTITLLKMLHLNIQCLTNGHPYPVSSAQIPDDVMNISTLLNLI